MSENNHHDVSKHRTEQVDYENDSENKQELESFDDNDINHENDCVNIQIVNTISSH